jgi:predicted metal-dependent hydrolase
MVAVQLGLPFHADRPADIADLGPAPAADTASAFAPGASPKTLAGQFAGGFYYVRHRRARRYLLRVDPDGRVRVTIPRGGSRREADAFAARNREWIARQLERLARPSFSVEERRLLRTKARRELPARLLELAHRHGLAVSRITIRNQRTRWGSCGRDGHITLNWRLVVMPEDVRDYVLVHELMHLRRLDHSKEYWRLVAAAYPGYREARHWLRQHGPSLR